MPISEIIKKLYDLNFYNVSVKIYCENSVGVVEIRSNEDFDIFTNIFGDCYIDHICPYGVNTIELSTLFRELSEEELQNKLDEYYS